MISSKATSLVTFLIECHTDLYAFLHGEISGQVLKNIWLNSLYDIPIMILVKVIYPSLLQREYFLFLNFSEIIQAFLYHPSRGSYTNLAVAVAVEDVKFLLVLPIPVSKPKTVVFDGSLSSVGVCHNEGVGAGEVTLF